MPVLMLEQASFSQDLLESMTSSNVLTSCQNDSTSVLRRHESASCISISAANAASKRSPMVRKLFTVWPPLSVIESVIIVEKYTCTCASGYGTARDPLEFKLPRVPVNSKKYTRRLQQSYTGSCSCAVSIDK
jgi:hypothetical protein